MTDRAVFVRLGAIVDGLKKGFRESSAAARQLATDAEKAGSQVDKAMGAAGKSGRTLVQAGERIGGTWKKVGKPAEDLTTQLVKNREAVDQLGNRFTVMGGLALAGVGVATKRLADFDFQMSAVGATGSDAKSKLGALREEAIKLGADTVFSASEAANGIEQLLKAGVSAKDVLGGGLAGSLDLAASSAIDVGTAAEIAATALKQYNLSGNQVGHVADLLAAGAGKAQGEVTDLALALKYVGPVASGMGVSIEETVGALAAFASQGILADQAGTSLRGVLAALTSPSQQAKDEIKRLGITLYDQQGNFLGLTNMAGELSKAYSGMTDQARDASLGILFGNQQVTAARVLFAQGADGVASWTKQVTDAGYASRAAATRLDNLRGDIEQLSGAIESRLIEAGSGVNDSLRDATQGATGFVNALGDLPKPTLGVITRLTALTGAGLLLTGVVMKGASGWANYQDSLQKLQTTSPRVASGLDRVGKSAKTAAGALVLLQIGAIFGEQYQANLDKTRASLDDITAALTSAAKGNGLKQIDDQIKQIAPDAVSIGDAMRAVKEVQNDPIATEGTAFDAWASGLFGVKTQYVEVQEQIAKTDQSLAAMDSESAAAAFNKIAESAKAQGVSMTEVASFFPQYQARLKSIATQYGVNIDAEETWAAWMGGKVPDAISKAVAANTKVTSGLSDVDRALVGATESGQNYGDAVATAAEQAEQKLRDLEDAIFAQANAALKLSGTELGVNEAILDANETLDKNSKLVKKNGGELSLLTKEGIENKRVLDQIQTSSTERINSMIEEGKSAGSIRKETERLRKAYIEAAEKAGYSATEAKNMADAANLIPKDILLKIAASGTRTVTGDIGVLQKSIKDLPADKQIKVLSAFIDDGVKGAEKALRDIDGKTATTYIETVYRINKRSREEGRNQPKALGGEITGGTRGVDSVPILAMPGEHMWTTSEVEGAGGHDAMFRMRALARAGMLPRFASGGPVEPTWSGKPLSYWEDHLKSAREITELKIRIRDLKKDLAAHGKNRLKGLDRTEARQERKETQTELDLALKAAQLNKSSKGTIAKQIAAYEKAKADWEQQDAAAQDRAKYAGDLATSVRRGTIGEQVRNGQGLSVIDEMLSWSKDPSLSSSARSQLAKTAGEAEAKLTALYGQLETANQTVQTLQQTYDSVKSALTSAGPSLADLAKSTFEKHTDARGNTWYTEKQADAASMVAAQQAQADKLKTLAGKVHDLQMLGASPTFLQKLLALDPDQAISVADMFLRDSSQIAAWNAAEQQIDLYSGQTAQYVTESMSEGGLAAAQAMVDQLMKQADTIGSQLAAAFAAALGLKINGTNLTGLAGGGYTAPGVPYLVGERKPEIHVGNGGWLLNEAQAQQALRAWQTPLPSMSGAAAAAVYQFGDLTYQASDLDQADRDAIERVKDLQLNGRRWARQGV